MISKASFSDPVIIPINCFDLLIAKFVTTMWALAGLRLTLSCICPPLLRLIYQSCICPLVHHLSDKASPLRSCSGQRVEMKIAPAISLASRRGMFPIVWTVDQSSTGSDLCRGRAAFKTRWDYCCTLLLHTFVARYCCTLLLHAIVAHFCRLLLHTIEIRCAAGKSRRPLSKTWCSAVKTLAAWQQCCEESYPK